MRFNPKYQINKLVIDSSGKKYGILAINKPKGITSHDVVNTVRNILNMKKVGHAGALDPFATGVLLVLVGNATKLSDHFLNKTKQYVASVVLGIQTETLDPEGKIISLCEIDTDEKQIKDALLHFLQVSDQYPPIFSSVKIQGEKLRVLARRSESYHESNNQITFRFGGGKEKTIELQPRPIEISELQLEKCTFQKEISELNITTSLKRTFGVAVEYKFPVAEISMTVSKGFYVRKFAQDLGNYLQQKAGGSLIALERIASGDVLLEDCLTLEELSERFVKSSE